jgi:hypothetical protein
LKQSRWIAAILGLILITLIVGFAVQPTEAQILGTGWVGKFYNNTNLSGSPVANDVPYPYGLCAVWGQGAPAAGSNNPSNPCTFGQPLNGVNSDNFSATFTSTQNFGASGEYLFTLRYNDGIRLVIDGQTVFEDFDVVEVDVTGECANRCKQSTVTLNLPSGTHNLKVDYVEFTGEAIIQVQWGFTAGNYPTITPVYTLQTMTPQPVEELIQNGGFEGEFVGDYKGNISQWKLKNGKGDRVKCNRYNQWIAFTGDCAFRFKGSVGENSKLEQNINPAGTAPTAAEGLTFNTFIYGTGANIDANIKIIVKYADNTEKTKRTIEVLNGLLRTDFYLPISDQFPFASPLVDKFKVQFNHKSLTGKLYVDEVSLRVADDIDVTQTPQPTTEATQTLEPTPTILPPTLPVTTTPGITETLETTITETPGDVPTEETLTPTATDDIGGGLLPLP